MLKINKILSVALVVLMLLSTIAIGVYAVPAEGTDVGLGSGDQRNYPDR